MMLLRRRAFEANGSFPFLPSIPGSQSSCFSPANFTGKQAAQSMPCAGTPCFTMMPMLQMMMPMLMKTQDLNPSGCSRWKD